MHRMKINTTPIAFYNNSMKHLYQLDLDKKHFVENKIVLTKTNFALSSGAPKLWNNFVNT